MKRQDGSLITLYQYGAGIIPVTPPVTQQILWMDNDTFACVSSGRRCSFYEVYRLERENPDNRGTTLCCLTMAEGCLKFRAIWSIRGGKLVGSLREAPYIEIGK